MKLLECVSCVDLITKCTTLLINVIVYGYRLIMNLNNTIKLLTFINENFAVKYSRHAHWSELTWLKRK